MKKTHFRKTLIALSVLVILSVACNRDRDNGNTPARYILESESLAIPAEIELPANDPAGNERTSTFYAEGVQIYKSQPVAGSNPLTYEWAFVAPKADLFDISNNKVGTHTAGPSWQLSPADSIYAQAFSPAKTAPGPDAGSVPWLLLRPKEGKTQTGIFAEVDYIQRIATKGGKAPVQAPVNAGQTIEIKYTAVYRFSKIK